MARFYPLVQRNLGCECRIGLTYAVCLSLFSLFACGQDQAPAQKTALLIEKLQAAKAIDAENLADSHTDSTQAADSIYQAQKAQIVIGQLKGRDELGEQTHGPGNDWLAWDSYRQQRGRADSIVKALENGEEVPWSEIQQALRVPEEP
jgi:hypothetical protein